MNVWIAKFLIAILSSLLARSASVLPTQHPLSAEPPPLSLNNKTTIERLFKRSLSCTFNNGDSGFCDNTAYCCWKFVAGADNPGKGGGFCCPDTQELGGGCCGNDCCPYGQYCAWADSQGHYSCIPDASTGSGYPTITSTQTATVTQTLTKTQTMNVTNTQTLTQTSSTTLPPTVACTTRELSATTGALAGGVVGGLSLLGMAVGLLMAGVRKGWFRAG